MDSGKKTYTPLALVRSNPKVAAVISKLTTPREKKVTGNLLNRVENSVDQSQLSEMSQSISQRILDNSNILQLFPDIELASQILISSIISPKDMVKTELLYKSNKKDIPNELNMAMLGTIGEILEKKYKINDKIPKMLKEMLFVSGAYAVAIIPENAIDQIINNPERLSTEDLKTVSNWSNNIGNLGFLGDFESDGNLGRRHGLESIESILKPNYNGAIHAQNDSGKWVSLEDTNVKVELTNGRNKEIVDLPKDVFKNISITDDFRILSMPNAIQTIRKHAINNTIAQLSLSTESVTIGAKDLTNTDFTALLYRNSNSGMRPLVTIPTDSHAVRKSIGDPLILKFPTESVIPVYTPGDESNHIGYFVLLDGDGHPITKNILNAQLNGQITPLGDQSASMSSLLLKRAQTNLLEMTAGNSSLTRQNTIYTELIESDLLERLKKGIYGENVGISRNNDVYRIMLARSLANQYTKMLYIPRELMTYFMFDHYDNGIGKSLLDDLRVMLSLRAIILFSKVMALTKNSIATTHVNMTLDPEDPDPRKTIEEGMHEIIRMRQQYFPLGINSPVDLVDWVQRAGLEFTFEGHPGIPNTRFDFENKSMQYTPPDSELDEALKKQTYMHFGLSPETVDNGFNSEFATTVVSNNILLSKRVSLKQDEFTPQITEHIKKIIHNDPNIKVELIKSIKENIELIKKYITDEENAELNENQNTFIEKYYRDFLESFSTYLPKPDTTTVETQEAAYNVYAEALEKILDAFISSEFITPAVAGEFGNSVDMIKSTYKAYFLRKWCTENGYFTELSSITESDSEGNPVLDLFQVSKDHLDGVIRSSVNYIKSMSAMAAAANKDLADVDSSGSTSSDSGGDDFGSTGEDDFGSGITDDISSSSDNPIDDNSTDSEAKSNEDTAIANKDNAEANLITEKTDEDKAKEGDNQDN
jgi:hypothetical protein